MRQEIQFQVRIIQKFIYGRAIIQPWINKAHISANNFIGIPIKQCTEIRNETELH
jgi:hypothetical protein